jgi:hypothetical protein
VDTPEPAGTAAADDLATSNDVNMNEEWTYQCDASRENLLHWGA